MTDPDAILIQKAQAGDKAAYGKLVDQYYEMVHAVAYGVLRNHENARDVAQEVFLKVYHEIVKFEGKSKFKTWLYRITVNRSLDEARKKRPMQSLDATDESDDPDRAPVIIVDKSKGPRDEARHHELRAILDQAIEQLSAEHRAVLVLREWEELSYEEIAETLGLEMGTVMSRLHYARKKLGEILKNDEQY